MITTRLKNHWFVIWYSYRFAWLQYTSILGMYYQRDELERLIRWAHRKKLISVREHYQRLLCDVEMRLSAKAIRYRRLAWIADIAHYTQVTLVPPPRFYSKGAAAKYRLCNRSLI